MKPIVDAVASEQRDRFIVARLDIDRNPDTLRKYGVRSIPNYIIFKNGEVAGEFIGAMHKEVFVQRILDILK